MRVSLDTYHSNPSGIRSAAQQQELAHSFAARRDALGQRLVHYYHRWFRLLRILTREGAPSKNGHSERFEISIAHGRLICQRSYSIGRRWFPFYAERRGGNAVQSQVWAIDANQPVADVYSMEQRMSDGLSQRRFNMLLFGIFAGLALLLASIGIYGVLAYTVTQRMREIGIRIALGASARNVAGLVLRQGLLLALAGVVIGGGAAFALTRWMESLIFGVSPTDPVTFSAVSTLLVAIALAASYVPARRAVRLDPMRSLRIE